MGASERLAVARLNAIDRQRAALVAQVAAMSPDQQRWRDGPTEWSAVEVVEHLVLAEQVVLGDFDTIDARPDRARRPVHRLRALLVWLVLRLGVRVRVPADAMRPTGQRTFHALRMQWDTQHRALRAFVLGLDERGLRRRVFHHPIAGPLDVLQALALLSAHLNTHRRQLRRLHSAWRDARAD